MLPTASSDVSSERQPRVLTFFALALTGILLGGCLGAATNAVNGRVSALYFVTILGWGEVANLERAIVAQGVFEGLLFGTAFSLVFASVAGLVTHGACRFGFAVRHLLCVPAGALAGWLIGGAAAMGLAALSPEFYQATFRGVPGQFGPMLRYAWVGGSIWGVQLGGLTSLVLSLVALRNSWRAMHGG